MKRKLFFITLLISQAAFTVLADKYEAISFASQELTLSFPTSGKIKKIHLKEGQQIEAGSILIEQDDSELQLQLKRLVLELRDDRHAKAAQLKLDKEQRHLDLLIKAGDAVQPTELCEAEFALSNAKLDVAASEMREEKLRLDKKQLEHRIEQTKLKSPIKAVVEKIYRKTGENVERIQQVIYLVNIDTLYFDVPVELTLAAALKPGDDVTIQFPDKSQLQARLIYKSSQAEAVSATRIIRLELLNKNKRPAGEKVSVTFKEKK